MPNDLSGLSDEIKLISFGKTLHPLTFFLSFSFGYLFMIPIIDAYGLAPGILFCLLVLCGGYALQRFLASKLQKQLLITIDTIDFYKQEIMEKISQLSGSVERDVAFVGMNVSDIDDVRKHFSSLIERVYDFRRALRMYNFIDFLFLSFGEREISGGYKEVVRRIGSYLGEFLSESLVEVQDILRTWIKAQKSEFSDTITSLSENQPLNTSGKGVFELAIRRLESHKSDLDKLRAHI